MKSWIIAIIVIVVGFFFVKYALPETYTGFISNANRMLFGNIVSQTIGCPEPDSLNYPNYLRNITSYGCDCSQLLKWYDSNHNNGYTIAIIQFHGCDIGSR